MYTQEQRRVALLRGREQTSIQTAEDNDMRQSLRVGDVQGAAQGDGQGKGEEEEEEEEEKEEEEEEEEEEDQRSQEV